MNNLQRLGVTSVLLHLREFFLTKTNCDDILMSMGKRGILCIIMLCLCSISGRADLYNYEDRMRFLLDLSEAKSTYPSVAEDLVQILNSSDVVVFSDYSCVNTSKELFSKCSLLINRQIAFDEIHKESFVYKIVFYVITSLYKPRALKITDYEALYINGLMSPR